MKLPSITSKYIEWKLRKRKSKQNNDDSPTTAVDEISECVSDTMQDTIQEIGDALHYYFLNPNKLSYDMAYELTVDDIIFPVSPDGRERKKLEC
jgi:hypothetical protein